MSRLPRPVSRAGTRSNNSSNYPSEDEEVRGINGGRKPSIINQLIIGDRVCLSNGKTGVLRYIGAIEYKNGKWAGIELDNKQGLNDGSLNGIRYFNCDQEYGMFVPLSKVSKLEAGRCNNSSTASSLILDSPSSFRRSSSVVDSSPASSMYRRMNSSGSSSTNSSTTQQRVNCNRTVNITASNGTSMTLAKTISPAEKKFVNTSLCRNGNFRKSTLGKDSVMQNMTGTWQMNEQQERSLCNLTLERDKALSRMESMRRQIEDLEFQLEEEKACRQLEDEEMLNGQCTPHVSTVNVTSTTTHVRAVQTDFHPNGGMVKTFEIAELKRNIDSLCQERDHLIKENSSIKVKVEALTCFCSAIELGLQGCIDVQNELRLKENASKEKCNLLVKQNSMLHDQLLKHQRAHRTHIDSCAKNMKSLEHELAEHQNWKRNHDVLERKLAELMEEIQLKDRSIAEQNRSIEELKQSNQATTNARQLPSIPAISTCDAGYPRRSCYVDSERSRTSNGINGGVSSHQIHYHRDSDPHGVNPHTFASDDEARIGGATSGTVASPTSAINSDQQSDMLLGVKCDFDSYCKSLQYRRDSGHSGRADDGSKASGNDRMNNDGAPSPLQGHDRYHWLTGSNNNHMGTTSKQSYFSQNGIVDKAGYLGRYPSSSANSYTSSGIDDVSGGGGSRLGSYCSPLIVDNMLSANDNSSKRTSTVDDRSGSKDVLSTLHRRNYFK